MHILLVSVSSEYSTLVSVPIPDTGIGIWATLRNAIQILTTITQYNSVMHNNVYSNRKYKTNNNNRRVIRLSVCLVGPTGAVFSACFHLADANGLHANSSTACLTMLGKTASFNTVGQARLACQPLIAQPHLRRRHRCRAETQLGRRLGETLCRPPGRPSLRRAPPRP